MGSLSRLTFILAMAVASTAFGDEAPKREDPAAQPVRSSTAAAGDELGRQVFNELLAVRDDATKDRNTDLAGAPSGSR